MLQSRFARCSLKGSHCFGQIYYEKTLSSVLYLSLTQNLLKKHETDGSARFFTPQEKQSLTKYFGLGSNRRVLTEWAILGRGHIGQVSQHQIADYVICNDQLRTIDDYINKLNEKLKKRPDTGFGTGFSWTRQSRGTGKTIQLKGPVW